VGGIFEEKRGGGERFYFRWVTCYLLTGHETDTSGAHSDGEENLLE